MGINTTVGYLLSSSFSIRTRKEMNEAINKRLLGKVETVIERVEFITEHLSQQILRDRLLRKALYKEFQEAVSDVCAMLRRRLNSSAKDDYSNIDFSVVVLERIKN